MSCDARKLLAVIAFCVALPAIAFGQSTYVKVADEWGTIQPGGPRAPNGGNRNWNIEGSENGAFTSTGTLRFYMADLVSRLSADFPGGWQIDKVTLVVEHDDAGFSLAGPVDIFHISDDAVAFTNGMDSNMGADAAPGNFGTLAVSPLVFDDTAPAQTGGASLGTVTLVNNYMFSAQGDDNLDVFGTTGSVANPAGATNVTPDYTLSFPTSNDPDETLVTFETELATDAGDWIPTGLDTIVADIEDGTDALSFIFAPGSPTVAATYKGNPFGILFPPRIYIQASSTGAGGVLGDYNGNGTVDAADYVLWRNGGPLLNEGDNPGTVDQGDYAFWRARFGLTSASGAGLDSAAVPEPVSAILLLTGLASLCWTRRSR